SSSEPCQIRLGRRVHEPFRKSLKRQGYFSVLPSRSIRCFGIAPAVRTTRSREDARWERGGIGGRESSRSPDRRVEAARGRGGCLTFDRRTSHPRVPST